MTSEREKLTAQIRALIVQHCYPFSDVSIGGDRQAAEAIAALHPPVALFGDHDEQARELITMYLGDPAEYPSTTAAIARALRAAAGERAPAGDRESVVSEIAAECRRHIEVEGWTPKHDDGHVDGEMAAAAACYALWDHDLKHQAYYLSVRETVRSIWPWDAEWWKPKDRRRDLIRAASLIVKEIERLDRAALNAPGMATPEEIRQSQGGALDRARTGSEDWPWMTPICARPSGLTRTRPARKV